MSRKASVDEEEELKIFVYRSLRDPVAGILLKYSNLTKTQYETLIIDLISSLISEISLTYEEKALFRSKRVSRGSYSRTLSQARRNIISAIYTILLLSYIGIFEGSPFDEYHVLAEKLKEYAKFVQESRPSQAANVLKRIEKELMDGIKKLAEPKSLKIV